MMFVIRFIKKIFSKKKADNRLTLPVYDENKYDTLYNKTSACKRHEWFFFYSEIDFIKMGFNDIGLSKSSNRICEKCFLWESKFMTEGSDWHFIGFGELAFNKLTEKKIDSIIK